MRTLICIIAVGLCAPALAQDAASEATFEILDAKVCSGITDKEAADNQTDFTTGDKAWIWMKVRPQGNAELKMKYTLDGNHVWTMDPVEARLGRLWYYKTIHAPGNWKVEIIDGADKVIKELTFTATGDPVQINAGGDTAEAAEAVEAVEAKSSTHLSVVDLKLSTEIKDRDPVDPATTFTQGVKVYAWTRLHVKDPETQVKVRWHFADQPVYTSDAVTVKQSPGWRTWTYKTVDTAGAWKVEVLDVDDIVVHSVAFNVN